MGSKSATEVPEVLRGSVVVHRRRCGKSNCRCALGESLHEQVVLSYSEQSRARSVTIPDELVEQVREATERYRAERQHLEEKGNAGLRRLVEQLRPHP
ncbi:MAG TPA: DUF6788 family protein [Acidimicrobiales bacterium]|nr:DUF6788 family protein [Acidimicrobiales bacterium]